tara:strand:- start:2179 stop:4425 length:2247 start_codon:yes stop_codon:yes gene_type:complete
MKNRLIKSLVFAFSIFISLFFLIYGFLYLNPFGSTEPVGKIINNPIPKEIVGDIASDTLSSHVNTPNKNGLILFGDTHVHTTFSTDAFRMSLPIVQGDGTHPPADACNFARYCSNLDFFALTDHAESLSPNQWIKSKESIRQCNAVSLKENPNLVAFTGFEWTQLGNSPEEHFGHKNVIFQGIEEEELPIMPIGSDYTANFRTLPWKLRYLTPLLDFPNRQRYFDFYQSMENLNDIPNCNLLLEDKANAGLKPCLAVAKNPRELFSQLEETQLDSIVIPHGTTWGIYTPPGEDLALQLEKGMHDPKRQILMEVFSGHGNSEEYRNWRAVKKDESGKYTCPTPFEGYTPSCWHAGEIIFERCLDTGIDRSECSERASLARKYYVESESVAGFKAVSGVSNEEWLDAGQCTDCYLPAFNYRPAGSAQYALALSNTSGETPLRFRFGLIASSDNHSARPGTGYKEFSRGNMSDWWGFKSSLFRNLFTGSPGAQLPKAFPVKLNELSAFNRLELERASSFFYTGGLVAVHAESRSRQDIWKAFKERRVYGTSGKRILLSFTLMNPPNTANSLPMGSEVEMSEEPIFRVKATGSLKQLPGCPDYSFLSLGSEEIERLCKGECYNPDNQRNLIEKIQIVRIFPQIHSSEIMGDLIEDNWLNVDCSPNPDGCELTFSDPEFTKLERDVVYYVKVFQEPELTINGNQMKCEYDKSGNCQKVDLCLGDDREQSLQDDCLSASPGLAWSSPIFIDFKR